MLRPFGISHGQSCARAATRPIYLGLSWRVEERLLNVRHANNFQVRANFSASRRSILMHFSTFCSVILCSSRKEKFFWQFNVLKNSNWVLYTVVKCLQHGLAPLFKHSYWAHDICKMVKTWKVIRKLWIAISQKENQI